MVDIDKIEQSYFFPYFYICVLIYPAKNDLRKNCKFGGPARYTFHNFGPDNDRDVSFTAIKSS